MNESAPDEHAVHAANARFYEAFAERDRSAMRSVWAEQAPIACVHPGWQPLFGREAVLASWDAILGGPEAPDIAFAQPRVQLYGDTAMVVCVETLPGGLLVATNLFVREEGAWRLVHHHSGPLSEPLDLDDEPPAGGLLN